MSKDESELRQQFEDEYKEFERRMELFENGPTTTNFQQLLADGIALPEPDSNPRRGCRLQVVAGDSRTRAVARIHSHQTDHLSDRELYGKLWHEVLRTEVPAIDLIGFNTHVRLTSIDDEQEICLYLTYYADDKDRQSWLEEFPGYEMPAHEDPAYSRDWRLPTPNAPPPAEAQEWLRENRNPSAFATNRFATTAMASDFVAQVYTAGASRVMIENICVLRAEERDLMPMR